MNWFTKSYVAHFPHAVKKKEVEQWGGCEHVLTDPSLLFNISYENDSFGREGYCMCEACHRKAQHQVEEEETVCHDCTRLFKRRDLTAWTPYDFYPREGDQPIYLCVRCQTQPKHLERIKHDREDAQAEFNRDDCDDF